MGLVLFSCEKNPPESAAEEQTKPTSPTHGIPSDKPNWATVPSTHYPTSMTIVCTIEGVSALHPDDELAAFLLDTCRAVGRIIDNVFYLGVPGPDDEVKMCLRYYSAAAGLLYEQAIIFYPDGRLGTADVPYVLTFAADATVPRRITVGASIATEASVARRANRGETRGGYNYIEWRTGDRITWWKGISSTWTRQAELSLVSGADTHRATFSCLSIGNMAAGDVVTYPSTTSFAGGRVVYTIPAEQTCLDNNFANDLLPMFGYVKVDGTAEMQVTASSICFQLSASTPSSLGETGIRIVLSTAETTNQQSLSGTFTHGEEHTRLRTDTRLTLHVPTSVPLFSSEADYGLHLIVPAIESLPRGTVAAIYPEGSDEPVWRKELKTTVPIGTAKTIYLPVAL